LTANWTFVDASEDSIREFSWGSASRPAGLPRYEWVPLKAAAGQATAVKLQIIWATKSLAIFTNVIGA
jgi:hypothetical protein